MRLNSRRMLRSSVVALLPILTLALVLVAAAPAPTRVVAVGDIHGAYQALVSVLQRAKIVNTAGQWVGGGATFVQIGDVLDRGERVRDCLDFLMGLESKAAKAGGKLIPLIGNHETMNMMHDLRYATPAIYRSFATDRSQKVQEKAYQDYLNFLSSHRDHKHALTAPAGEAERAKWLEDHPPGYFEYVDALGPRGKYGSWIRKHHAIVQVGEGLFVHGGLNPELKFRDVAELDDQVRSEIAGFDADWLNLAEKKFLWPYMTLAEAVKFAGEELVWIQGGGAVDDPSVVQGMQRLVGYRNLVSVSSNGPLWYRGLAQSQEDTLLPAVTAMLERLKAKYVVDGHTVVSKLGITTRFENRVFLIDTGMNQESFQGRASALEIQDGKFTAYYAEGEPTVLPGPARVGK
jgi:hypothetical protein